MEWQKLVINALLAGLWAGIAALQISGEISKAALWAAGTAAVRAVIGYVAEQIGHAVPVDTSA